jgi:tRNA A-37 threonylcarbamoyl transferase component Bud32
MSELSQAQPPPNQKAALLLREKLCDEFEQAIASDVRPAIENYLTGVEEEAQSVFLRELLVVELHYLDRAGHSPDIETYRRRFPRHHAILDELFGNKQLWQYPRIDSANTVLGAKRKPAALAAYGRRIHIRCPHCREAMDVATDAPLTGIVCEICGSQFTLAGNESQTTPPVLASIGHFELTARIGVGGFGTIWRAVDTKLDRVVAVKVPRSNTLDPQQALQLINEARAAAQLNHPNIVSVHEVGRDEDTIYIVSDFVNGITLSDWLEVRHPTRSQCVEVCIKIATALHHAHEAGIIHRDMKASNVLVDQNNEPRITDFGLAKREMVEATIGLDGKIFGTPAYMSPEQARGQGHHADRRTDIYSLGVMLYQLLTEELPFRGNTSALLHQVLHVEPPSPRSLVPSISRDLETICLKCLEKDPEKRYPTAKALADDLQRYQRHEPIAARPISRPERVWRWCRRNPMAATAAALLAIIAVASPVIALRERLHFLQERKLNEDNTRLIQRLTGDLKQQLAASHELRAHRQRGHISPTGQALMQLAFDKYKPVSDEILHSAATPEERCMATLGLAILTMEVRPIDEAINSMLKARDELELSLRNSADNLQLKAGLASCYDSLTELYNQSGQPEAARECWQKAELAWSQLAQSEPTLTNYHALAESKFYMPPLQSDAANLDGALSPLTDQMNAISPGNLNSFFPMSPQQLYEAACDLANRRAWLTQGKTAAAEDSAAPETKGSEQFIDK